MVAECVVAGMGKSLARVEQRMANSLAYTDCWKEKVGEQGEAERSLTL
jgi:hypothetical protein